MGEGKLLPPIQNFSNPEPLAYQSSALTTIPHCSLVTCGCERTGGGEERVGGCRINKNRQRIPLSNVEKESMDGSMQRAVRETNPDWLACRGEGLVKNKKPFGSTENVPGIATTQSFSVSLESRY